jgi:hypothetical protein
MSFQDKYLKYKNKYILLKQQIGGVYFNDLEFDCGYKCGKKFTVTTFTDIEVKMLKLENKYKKILDNAKKYTNHIIQTHSPNNIFKCPFSACNVIIEQIDPKDSDGKNVNNTKVIEHIATHLEKKVSYIMCPFCIKQFDKRTKEFDTHIKEHIDKGEKIFIKYGYKRNICPYCYADILHIENRCTTKKEKIKEIAYYFQFHLDEHKINGDIEIPKIDMEKNIERVDRYTCVICRQTENNRTDYTEFHESHHNNNDLRHPYDFVSGVSNINNFSYKCTSLN